MGNLPKGAMAGSTYLGVTGGEHIWRLSTGKTYSVDLVLGRVSLCVGLFPSQWRHPPRLPR